MVLQPTLAGKSRRASDDLNPAATRHVHGGHAHRDVTATDGDSDRADRPGGSTKGTTTTTAAHRGAALKENDMDNPRGRLAKLTVVISIGVSAALIGPGLADAQKTHPRPDGNAVIDWNDNAGAAALAACIAPNDNPLHESRMYAMMHLAIHDALNAIKHRSRPYVFDGDVRGRTSEEAAVAAAAHDVLVPALSELPAPFPQTCIDAGVAVVEADYADALDAISDGRAKSRGIELGQAAADAINALRADDGSDTPLLGFDYEQGTEPGEFRFPLGVNFAFAPGWGDVTPFVLRDGSQFRAPPPYPLSSPQYAADLNEVKRLGGDGATTPSARTEEQTEIARFWVESSPLQWNRIARTVASHEQLDLWESARLFGLLNVALADGYVGAWESKYFYNSWRPETAIELADNDGNPATTADPTWTPLQPTYSHPDHDSGHSVEGGAAAQVLTRFFGTDRAHFEVCSFTLPEGERCTDPSPVFRFYRSFSQASAENGDSRILVGIHFRKAVDDGIAHGRAIGDLTVDRLLRLEH